MSFRPVEESNYDLFLERTYLSSAILAGVGFGVQFSLFCYCVQALWNRKGCRSKRISRFILIFVLFILDTIYVACTARELQLAYIDNRDFPGGPLQYFLDNPTIPANTVAVAVFFLANVLADAFLLWRCKVIWSAYIAAFILGGSVRVVMVFPSVVFLASFTMGLLWTVRDTSPGSTLYSSTTVSLGLPYLTISLSLNIVLSLMIIIPSLLSYKKINTVSSGGQGSPQKFIMELTVESAALYSIFSIPFLVTYGINNPINQIFLGILTPVQLIATYLIIYREAKGLAWSKDTITASVDSSNASIVFAGRTRVSVLHPIRRDVFRGSSSSIVTEAEAVHYTDEYDGVGSAAENAINRPKKAFGV